MTRVDRVIKNHYLDAHIGSGEGEAFSFLVRKLAIPSFENFFLTSRLINEEQFGNCLVFHSTRCAGKWSQSKGSIFTLLLVLFCDISAAHNHGNWLIP